MDEYEYKERKSEKDPLKEFRFGEGRISGVVSCTLGLLSILAVLAYLYPSYLTTTELRQVYDAEQLQVVLKYGMYFSLLLGGLTFVLNKAKYKEPGDCGIGFTLKD